MRLIKRLDAGTAGTMSVKLDARVDMRVARDEDWSEGGVMIDWLYALRCDAVWK